MRPEKALLLYTREGCHLCEHAETLLQALGVDWQPVDIESDPELEEQYGLSIPVVRVPVSGHELAFPFDLETLDRFLNKGPE